MKINQNKTWIKAIMIFLVIQLAPIIILKIIPVEPIESNSLDFILATLLFILPTIIGFVFTYGLVYKIIKKKTYHYNLNDDFSRKQLKFNSELIFNSSVIGLALMLYDRIFVRGINYRLGFRNARYQWLYSEVSSSIWSKIGNLLVPFGYVGLWFLIIYKDELSKRQKLKLVIAAFCTVVGHAALNGGRSQILLGVVMWLSIRIILILQGKRKIRKEKYRKKISNNLVLLFVLSIVILLTLDGIGKSMGLKEYVINFAPTLLGRVNLSMMNNWSIFGSLGYILMFITMYLLHGQYSFRYAFTLTERKGYAFFGTLLNPFIEVLKLFGVPVHSIQKDYFTTKYAMFLSLPGALYYDGGYIGLVLLALILGLLFAFATISIKFTEVITGYRLAFILFVLFYIILSPVMSSSGFAYFYFIIYAFIAIETINRIKYKKKTNWLPRGIF